MDPDENLALQLAMNRETFSRLQEMGLKPDTQVQLDFSYIVPGKREASGLAQLLQSETDYDVEVSSTGTFFTKSWHLEGRTRETPINLPMLDQWVRWMVAAGANHNCQFDGWGTSL